MSYTDKISTVRGELRSIVQAIPETMQGFGTLSENVEGAGVLDRKQKEMLALGMAIVQRCEPCILLHVESFRKAGGTREELGDILGVAIQMSGGPGVMYSGHALAAWDEFAK
ncbi:carboxymuconolactone decarboxylase family protein [Thioclava sp. 'Guangxiensis']|uniref:carboxymuconolactone decarboxylase family protein n=1 Tax=Thioclava sp. 'Guangxiensis' TaxID=3149044 RepID=UPI003877EC2A